MSIESMPDPFATDYYKDFKDTQIDPYVGRVFQLIEEYNELIEGEFISPEQVNAIMNELDGHWRQLLQREATFTGVAAFLHVDTRGSDGTPTKEFYEDEYLVFNGVMPAELESIYVLDEKTDTLVEHHTYKLRLQLIREALDKDGKITKLKGVADIDDVISLQIRDTISVEGARKWLSYYHADDIDYIEIDLFNEAREECEKALRLGEHTVDVGGPHKGDEAMALRSSQALNAFTNSLISFDTDAPYLLQVEGYVWDPGASGAIEPSYAKGKQIAVVEKIVWLRPVGETRQIVVPHIATRLLHENAQTPSTSLLIPLSIVTSLRSYRYDYYVGYGNDTASQ